MKYKKKPMVIEAYHWCPESMGGEIEMDTPWLVKAMDNGDVWIDTDSDGGTFTMKIRTLEGVMRAMPGDYIIQGVNGELYPCKPDIFEKTYEKVEG